MPFPSRQAQTRIKHEILQDYIGAWAGIIGAGVRPRMVQAQKRGQPFTLDLVYVDGFAGFGRFERDEDNPSGGPVWGSPVLAMQALERAANDLCARGLKVRVTGIAVEKLPERCEELVTNLKEGVESDVRIGDSFSPDALGTVTVINDDFRTHVQSILGSVEEHHFLFAFIDPDGEAMPRRKLVPLIGRRHTDAIINFPSYQLGMRGGAIEKAPADRTSTDWQNIARTTMLYDAEDWIPIASDTSQPLAKRVEQCADLYTKLLREADRELVFKKIGLRFSKQDRPAYHLILATRDADGAIRMNGILRKADYEKYWAVWADNDARIQAQKDKAGILSLGLGVPHVAPPEPPAVEVPVGDVERALRSRLTPGEVYKRKEIWTLMANDVFLESEIRKALRSLRSQGVVRFDDLRSKTSPVRVLR